ncbi:PhzF family phenazine biosynthesis protein [Agaribacterium haliotis]|uniref:PhzF family phenazine biosynthesis protein n=1 Tax=Agaribacterium haliotis TaxID=2013869 RepID=UPI00195CCDF6|nr:PhzF family phenazine biosynthesis protein [Agaribacterium haliotis]
MKLKLFHVDAFAEQVFSGNPAAVAVLDEWLPEPLMQAIAAELNLSETAFVVPRADGDYRIRWFTPNREVNLCGHATLASAHVLYQHFKHAAIPIRFHSLSGTLVCMLDGAEISMDFPLQAPKKLGDDLVINACLATRPAELYANEDLIAILTDEQQVREFEPQLPAIAKLPYRGLIIAAQAHGQSYDFACRVFAPAYGIDEDPVTGSAYTKLGPLFADKLDKKRLRARQLSKRGGSVGLELQGDRIFISGKALSLMQSTMELPDF